MDLKSTSVQVPVLWVRNVGFCVRSGWVLGQVLLILVPGPCGSMVAASCMLNSYTVLESLLTHVAERLQSYGDSHAQRVRIQYCIVEVWPKSMAYHALSATILDLLGPCCQWLGIQAS